MIVSQCLLRASRILIGEPVQVALPPEVSAAAFAADLNHSLAAGSDGKLYAWGSNSNGQLGDGTTTSRTRPVQVALPAGVSVSAMAAGSFYSLALGSDGKLYAWGNNSSGQLLGDGNNDRLPSEVLGNGYSNDAFASRHRVTASGRPRDRHQKVRRSV